MNGNVLDQLPSHLNPTMLAGLDQFHAGGIEPVERLLRLGGVGPGMTVVDLGSGLGGPARLAASLGATVIGVDRNPTFVELAGALSARLGASDRVTFRVGDMTALDLPDAQADRVMLIHAQMNVPDKLALARTVARILRPGGELLAWEVCAADAGNVSWPTPWSLDGTDSHLVTSSALRAAFQEGGLRVTAWADRSEWATEWFQRTLAAPPAPGPSLVGMLERGPERVRNFARGLATGQLAIVEMVAHT
jgi:sarcosine/dimethylglycine N-methyltransferase